MDRVSFVSGAVGMIGSHLVDELVQRGTFVIALDPAPPFSIKKHVLEGKVAYIHGASFDVAQMNKIRRKWGGSISEVYGIGGILGSEEVFPRLDSALNFNVLGGRNEAELALDSGAKMFYILMEFVPEAGYVGYYNMYATSKNATRDVIREYVRQYGLKAVFGRTMYVVSERHGLLPVRKFLSVAVSYLALGRKVPVFGSADKRLEIVYAGDVAKIIVGLMRSDLTDSNVLYSIGSCEENCLTLGEISEILNREMRKRGRGVEGAAYEVLGDMRKQPQKFVKADNNWKEIVDIELTKFEDIAGKIVDSFLRRFSDDDFRLAINVFENRKNYGV